jgi:hypothetical protein
MMPLPLFATCDIWLQTLKVVYSEYENGCVVTWASLSLRGLPYAKYEENSTAADISGRYPSIVQQFSGV